MTFLEGFEAVHYRGIDGLSLPRLAHANLVTGVNGVGKTAVLEAMWLFAGRYNPPLLWNTNVQRSSKPVLDPVGRLTRGTLELRGTENGSPHRLKASFQKIADIEVPRPIGNPTENSLIAPPVVGQINVDLDENLTDQRFGGGQPTPWGLVVYQDPEQPENRPGCVILGTRFQFDTPNDYLQRYSDMVRANHKKDFANAINLILPRVRDVEILTDESGESYLSAVTDDGEQLPLHDLGGGVVRLYQLFLSFFVSRGGILYIDEVENGLHHSVLRDVWTYVRRWMHQWDVQLVATTHSGECIRAAMRAFEDAPDELAVHKLFRNEKTEQCRCGDLHRRRVGRRPRPRP